jgi:hypothetical protein
MRRKHLLLPLSALAVFLLIAAINRPANDEAQKKNLLRIAHEYKYFPSYEEPFDSLHWTVGLCAPYVNLADTVNSRRMRFSHADWKKSPHGHEVYELYVWDIESYTERRRRFQPDGQVIVKETWSLREMPPDSVAITKLPLIRQYPFEVWMTPTTLSKLFVMYKDSEDNTSDKGWVYGIVDVKDGIASATVMSNGRLSNCIACHKGTKYDRIFGTENMRGTY